jgi:hypothetical protein
LFFKIIQPFFVGFAKAGLSLLTRLDLLINDGFASLHAFFVLLPLTIDIGLLVHFRELGIDIIVTSFFVLIDDLFLLVNLGLVSLVLLQENLTVLGKASH